jgi:hypothetical protein
VSVAGGFVVERTTKPTQPPVMAIGVVLCNVVAWDAPPVLEPNVSWIESVPFVTVFPDASFMQTVIVAVETPFAGIGFGATVVVSWVGAPKPENEMVAVVDVSAPDVAVASHASTTESLRVNLTVVPVDGVLAVAGLPVPPAGVVLTVVAEQSAVCAGRWLASVTGVGPKTRFPAASWTCTVTSHVEVADA